MPEEEIAMAKKQESVKIEAKNKTPIKVKATAKKETPSKTKTPTKAKETVVKTKFEFSAPEAKEVYLVGDFNNWFTHATPMKKEKNGLWKTSISLKPGRYEFRFFVDDNWVSDLSCYGCVPNEFGTTNCVIIIE
jgi:1,4-alpha-glucan branching enzyme